MKLRTQLKNTLTGFLKLFRKEYLPEYWSIRKNEESLLAPINNFYGGFLYPGIRIIDVGANVGNYSRAFLNAGAKVVAVEPQRYCQSILKKRFKNDANFSLIPFAVGESVSKSFLHKSSSHTVASMNSEWISGVTESNRFGDEEKWNEKESIDVVTLDSVMEQHFIPDYLKIDVEGFELSVLKGLNQAIPFISFEITLPELQSNAEQCVKKIADLGEYEFCIPTKEKLTNEAAWKSDAAIILELDALSKNGLFTSTDIFARKIKIRP